MAETTFHTTFSTTHFLLSRAKNGSESGLRSAVSYRFGFNGKENDNEVKGTGNQQDYGMRIYDPRLGRFLSADPLIVQQQMYPWYSPYQFAGNKPIWAVDLDGLEERIISYQVGESNAPKIRLPDKMFIDKNTGKQVTPMGNGTLTVFHNPDQRMSYAYYTWDGEDGQIHTSQRFDYKWDKDDGGMAFLDRLYESMKGNSTERKTRNATNFEEWALKNADQSELLRIAGIFGDSKSEPSNANNVTENNTTEKSTSQGGAEEKKDTLYFWVGSKSHPSFNGLGTESVTEFDTTINDPNPPADLSAPTQTGTQVINN